MNTQENFALKYSLHEVLKSELVIRAYDYAKYCHESTMHLYDGLPYFDTHVKLVTEYAIKYIHLITTTQRDMETVIASSSLHDVIDDCRVTYSDVLKETNREVADVVYALTNEKGKNRSERANDKYYKGIKDTPLASFVKLCDRLANIKYSAEKKSSMLDKYRKEHIGFVEKLYDRRYTSMFNEMIELFSNEQGKNI